MRATSDTPGEGAAPAPSRGRPRSAAADRAILATAFRHLVEHGYGGLSVEAVAADAGVAKTTIYRRYPTRRDLVLAAFGQEAPFVPPPLDVGTRDALRHLVAGVAAALVESGALRVLASLLVEEQRDPGLLDAFRARILAPRRALVEELLRRGVERGEVRPDVDPLIVGELVAGALFGHHAILGLPASPAWIEKLTEHVWAAIEARPTV